MQYLLLSSSMVLAVVGQFFLKRGVLASSLNPNFYSIIKTLFSPYVLIGFFAYGASSIIWLFVLQRFPLSVAYPALSLTYVAIMIVSFLILNEPISAYKITGILFILIGVFLIFK